MLVLLRICQMFALHYKKHKLIITQGVNGFKQPFFPAPAWPTHRSPAETYNPESKLQTVLCDQLAVEIQCLSNTQGQCQYKHNTFTLHQKSAVNTAIVGAGSPDGSLPVILGLQVLAFIPSQWQDLHNSLPSTPLSTYYQKAINLTNYQPAQYCGLINPLKLSTEQTKTLIKYLLESHFTCQRICIFIYPVLRSKQLCYKAGPCLPEQNI